MMDIRTINVLLIVLTLLLHPLILGVFVLTLFLQSFRSHTIWTLAPVAQFFLRIENHDAFCF